MSGHADRALAERRKAQAVELRLAGFGYDRIAEAVGFKNRGTAHRTVMKALREHTDGAVKDLRAKEIERLDRLQNAVWDRAMCGDPRAVSAALRVIEARARLLGLNHVAEQGPMKGPVVQPRNGAGCLPGCPCRSVEATGPEGDGGFIIWS